MFTIFCSIIKCCQCCKIWRMILMKTFDQHDSHRPQWKCWKRKYINVYAWNCRYSDLTSGKLIEQRVRYHVSFIGFTPQTISVCYHRKFYFPVFWRLSHHLNAPIDRILPNCLCFPWFSYLLPFSWKWTAEHFWTP